MNGNCAEEQNSDTLGYPGTAWVGLRKKDALGGASQTAPGSDGQRDVPRFLPELK